MKWRKLWTAMLGGQWAAPPRQPMPEWSWSVTTTTGGQGFTATGASSTGSITVASTTGVWSTTYTTTGVVLKQEETQDHYRARTLRERFGKRVAWTVGRVAT